MEDTLLMPKSLLRCWWSLLGDVQQHFVNESMQDVGASVEGGRAGRAWRAWSAGWGASREKNQAETFTQLN